MEREGDLKAPVWDNPAGEIFGGGLGKIVEKIVYEKKEKSRKRMFRPLADP